MAASHASSAVSVRMMCMYSSSLTVRARRVAGISTWCSLSMYFVIGYVVIGSVAIGPVEIGAIVTGPVAIGSIMIGAAAMGSVAGLRPARSASDAGGSSLFLAASVTAGFSRISPPDG